MSIRVKNAKSLYIEGIKEGKPEEAVKKYTGERYTQHSTGVEDGQEGFIKFFKFFLERNPIRDIKILRCIEDGRFVFLHAFQSLNNGKYQWVTMDMFDTDQDSKIIEHWDVIAPFKQEEKKELNMINGTDQIVDLDQTESNKNIVRKFLVNIMQCREVENLDKYIDCDVFIDHNTDVGDIKSFVNNKKNYQYEFIFKVLGQGNFVVSYSKVMENSKEFATFDLFRLQNQKIVEHWDAREEIPMRSELKNS